MPKESVTKINSIATRCFLGLLNHATSAGVLAEISWPEPVYRAQIRMIREFFRLLKMDNNRLTKQIYFWDKSFSEVLNIQTWSSEVRDVLLTHNLGHIFEPQVSFCPDSVIIKLKESMALKQNVDLKNRCQEKPKLRTDIQFKDFSCKTSYLTIPISFNSRKH